MDLNKKNVVLIDVWCNYLDSLLALDNVNVKMLVTECKWSAQKCEEIYGNKIENFYYRIPITNKEFEELNQSDYNITYDEIERYRSTQLKCEHCLHREILDDGCIQYRYYLALKFWLGFFKNNKIDLIINCHPEHGGLWDSIILDIAKSLNIPIYAVTNSTGSQDFEINCITKLNDKSFIDIQDLNLKKIDFSEFFESIKKTYSFFENNKKRPKFSFKKFLNSMKNAASYFRYNYCYDEYKRYTKRNRRYIFWDNLPRHEIFQQTRYVNNLKKLYDKISTQPDFNAKYIYYPLHQEPESSIMARSTMTSQLFVIKLISETLPEGWKLYVKEHPSEFSIYEKNNYFLRNINYFRTPDFYNRIKSLKNVELIDVNVDGKQLTLNSSCVCSICGTSLLEGIIMDKPIFIWGKSVSFIELLSDAFAIDSREKLCKAMDKLTSGYRADYSDLKSVCEKYSFARKHYENMQFAKKDDETVKLLNFLVNG